MQNVVNSIVVFGDSILKGVITIPGSKNLFDVTQDDSLSLAQKTLGFELDNRSIYGNITSKGLQKLGKFLEKDGHADLCIIEFGSNDCDYDWNIFNEGKEIPPAESILPKVPLAEYVENLNQMISLCREHKITPVIMNLIPYVAEDWLAHLSKGHDKKAILDFLGGTASTLNENQKKYNAALLECAAKNNVQVFDVWSLFTNHADQKSLMCYDGIHPNEDGYKLLAEKWTEFLPAVKKEF